MSGELKEALKQRLDENYTAFMESLQGKTVSELIAMAPEITAAQQLHEELLDACDDEDVEYLLRFDDPLELVRGYWEAALTGYDHGEEMRHMLWELRDRELIEEAPKMIKPISTEDLRRMGSQEGLVLQGCGGDAQEWVDGINNLLTEAGILLEGSTFQAENVSTFEHDGLTNLLFPFEGVKLDTGKLAMWRIQTHDQFGGTRLSDYVPNRLDGFIHAEPQPQKPRMELLGQDGNIFGILGQASRLLKRAGMKEQADEMFSRVTSCGDYNKALNIISEYVETELSPTNPEPKKSHQKKGKTAYER